MSGLVSIRGHHRMLRIVEDWEVRPRNRSECRNAPRPCPWVSCRYHLATDEHLHGDVRVNEALLDPVVAGTRYGRPWQWHRGNGRRGHSKRQRTPWRLLVRYRDTCALDVADRGEHSSNAVAEIMGQWHTSIEGVLAKALPKFKARMRIAGYER